MSFERYGNLPTYDFGPVIGQGRSQTLTHDPGPLGDPQGRECEVSEELTIHCPTPEIVGPFGVEFAVADLAASINETFVPLGSPEAEFYTVLLAWQSASTAACWEGCNGEGHPCNSGTSTHPAVTPCEMDADMTDIGTWVGEQTGTDSIATSSLHAENFDGDGYPHDPYQSRIYWPQLPVGWTGPGSLRALLLNPSPPIAVPDPAGNEYGKVLFTIEQLPDALAITQIMLGYNPTHIVHEDLFAKMSITGFYASTPEDPPPTVQRLVDVL